MMVCTSYYNVEYLNTTKSYVLFIVLMSINRTEPDR